MKAPTLFVDSVFFSYAHDNLLQGACLNVPIGRCVGLLGRNGTGKSTLMKIIFGSITTENKCIRIDSNTYLESLYLSKGLVHYLPQQICSPQHLKIKDCFELSNVDFEEVIRAFPEIESYRNHSFKQLSGGWVRLVEILIALYGSATFVLLDEPFSHLSPIHVGLITKLIETQKVKKGILISDHLYKTVVAISDDLYLLANKQTYHIKNTDDLEFYGYIPPKT